jgi:hypothetical protein
VPSVSQVVRSQGLSVQLADGLLDPHD